MKNKADLINEIESMKEFQLTPLYVEGELGQFVMDKNLNGIVFKGETEIISTVSNRYRLIQFRDIFKPAIQNIPNLEGHISTYKGKAILFVFPEGDSFIGEHNSRIGLAIRNSVDKSSAIGVSFAILFDGYSIALPADIKPFRKIHTGKPLELTSDFLEAVTEIKNSWKLLVEKYKEFNIDTETKESIFKELKITKNVRVKINEKEIKNLWELFIATLDTISRKSFKSEIHKQKKIEKIVDIFTTYSIGVSL